MSLIDSIINAVKKFSSKPSSLDTVKEQMAPAMSTNPLPSEQMLKAYETRHGDSPNPVRPPIETIREPKIPLTAQSELSPPIPRPIAGGKSQLLSTQSQDGSENPKIDLILAEIETVKAQLKALSEKLDVIESYYRKSGY